jgi:hypothetical protein
MRAVGNGNGNSGAHGHACCCGGLPACEPTLDGVGQLAAAELEAGPVLLELGREELHLEKVYAVLHDAAWAVVDHHLRGW